MYCCANCFKDPELRGFIIASDSGKVADCDFCGTTDTKVIDPQELEESFQPIVNLFKPLSEIGARVSDRKLFYEKLQENWNLFNIPDSQIKRLMSAILSGIYSANDPFLTTPVDIAGLFQHTSDDHERRWDNFAQEIKYQNRYFLEKTIDLELLKALLANLKKTYAPGKVFYRGRVSDKMGLPLNQMGKPSADKAISGRANPYGIPYLYVSTTPYTTVYESRSTYFDFLSVAQFVLGESLGIISLRDIKAISPFVFGENLENFIVHQKYLGRLEKELSRPVRRYDKELDYLPTQYLCEYVKSLGYDAIEYASSLNSGGINLAIFNDSKLKPVSVSVYEIKSVDLKIEKLSLNYN